MHTPPYLLLVDGDARTGRMLSFARQEYRVVRAPHAQAALPLLHNDPPDVVLIGPSLPNGDCLDLLAEVRARQPGVPVILLCDAEAPDRTIKGLRNGAYDVIQRPAPLDVIHASLRRALDYRRLLEQGARQAGPSDGRCAEWEAGATTASRAQGMLLVGRMVRGFMREIANPLSVIRVNANLLEMTANLDNGNVRRLHAIGGALDHIQETIKVLQAFAFASADPAPVHLCELAQEVVDHLVNTGRLRACGVQVVTKPGLPILVTRPDQVRQALSSILLNAEAAAAPLALPECEIVITAAQHGSDLCLDIHHEGQFAPNQELERVFELLVSDEIDTGRLQGTGLGLYLARQVIETNGGRLELDSEPGGRVTVRLLFPLRV